KKEVASCALTSASIESLDQSQKSEGTYGYPRHRPNMPTRTIMPSATRNKTSSEPSPRPPEKPKYLSKKSTDFVPKKAARNRTGRSRYGPKFQAPPHPWTFASTPGTWAHPLTAENNRRAYGKHDDDNNQGNEHAANVCVHDLGHERKNNSSVIWFHQLQAASGPCSSCNSFISKRGP